MRNSRELLIWSAVGLAGMALLAWAYPRVFPLLPGGWEVSRAEAETIALERFRDLGEPAAEPYVVVRLRTDFQLERRMQLLATQRHDPEALAASWPAQTLMAWDVRVFDRGATPQEWTHYALISRVGEVLALRRESWEDDDSDETLDEAGARRQAAEFLESHGFDLARYDAEPEVQRDEVGNQTSLLLRYRQGDLVAGEYPYGVEVHFDRGAPSGFGFWLDDARVDELQGTFRQVQLVGFGRVALFYFLLPLVAVPFLKRYHDGQLGVRRGMQFFFLSLAAGIVFIVLNARIISSGTSAGFLTRHQTTWMVGGFSLVFQFLGLAVLALMAWSVGESLCRERWPQKLASLDALFRLKWRNATVARSSLRGLAAGTLMAGVLFALATVGHGAGAWAITGIVYGGSGFDSAVPALSFLTGNVSYFVPIYLFVCLLVPCWATDRLGSSAGLAFAVLTAVVIAPVLFVLPLEWGWAMWAVVAGVPVLLFRFGDLLSGVMAGLTAALLTNVVPALFVGEPSIRVHGLVALGALAAPLIASVRYLGSDEEFVYTYDDVPPHVRRIAERERQRVEIETARNIQSSILPELPPQLNGVEISHSYLPASEVGGDFYDVLALDDGRLAVAVGDVAGHGVSSGLVMSMARSALAVQVTFDPAVESVFATLNRMVFQSARRRLLSTLVYAILDPAQGELHYASAGHVFPYLVSPSGDVEPLKASSYPLGVRGEIDVRTRTSKLEVGDSVFMYSDGLVEATPEDSDEPFGFDRLEASLKRHAAKSPRHLRDAVLADVESFTGRQVRDDDLTVLVLRLPAA